MRAFAYHRDYDDFTPHARRFRCWQAMPHDGVSDIAAIASREPRAA